MTEQLEVLIAGGGIGGLAAALACARRGQQVRLFERSPQFTEVGAGIQISPNVVRVLQSWGLQEALAEVAAFPEALQVRSALSGAVLARLPFQGRCESLYGAPYATIHRADLHQMLLRAVQQQPLVSLRTAATIEACGQTHDEAWLGFAKALRIEGDVLVGADGLWSVVRPQLLGAQPVRVTGHLAYRAMVRQTDLPESVRSQQVTAWLGPGMHVVAYPVRAGGWLNVVAIVSGRAPDDLANWDHSANGQHLMAGLHHTCKPLRDLLQAVPAWRLWALCDRPPVASADEMAQGRIALLGDAAHPMRPYLAQGAGMAIEDADELAQALCLSDMDVPTRLRRYALNRWQRCARVQARAERNGRIFHAAAPIRWARDLSLRWLGARLLDVPWLYQGNPLLLN